MKPEKRDKILAAADKLFNHFGIRKTGMDEIARLSRVARGTLYNYFGSKEGILDELVRFKLARFEEILGKKLAGVRDPVEKLRAVIRERILVTLNTPFLFASSLAPEEGLIRSMYRELDRRSGIILDRVIEGLYAGGLPVQQKESILRTLLFTLRGIESSLMDRPEPPGQEQIEADIDTMVGMVLSRHIPGGN